jgi:uncharacterized protein YyaL (SSP411 family)
MALNLHRLGLLLDKPEWSELSDKMLSQMKKLVLAEPQFLSNWACLFAYRTTPTAEIAIVGPDAQAFRKEIDQMYYPNKVLAGTASKATCRCSGTARRSTTKPPCTCATTGPASCRYLR